jgi:anti-sigma B factor antagonist
VTGFSPKLFFYLPFTDLETIALETMQITMNPTIKVVQPTGILDSTQVDHFYQVIDEAVQTHASTILVDLREVTFMDSSGLGALVVALKTARSFGKRLCICSINAQVKILFELTSMDQVFEIFSNQDHFCQVAAA